MTFRFREGQKRIVYDESTRSLPPPETPPKNQTMENHRLKGFSHDSFVNPRLPITDPYAIQDSLKRNYSKKQSLIKGKPVQPNGVPEGFTFGSDAVGKDSAQSKKERKTNLRLLEKTSGDIRKFQKQQADRLEFMNAHQKARKIQNLMAKKEKEEDLKLLTSYNPFGKPGYGAPRGSGKALSIQKTMGASNGSGLVITETPEFMSRPANRDKVPVKRIDDPRIKRYRVEKTQADTYRHDLDKLMAVKKNQQEVIKSLDKEVEVKMLTHDPYGKPGAGAPNRDENGDYLYQRTKAVTFGMISPTLPRRGNLKVKKNTTTKGKLALDIQKRKASPDIAEKNMWDTLGLPPSKQRELVAPPPAAPIKDILSEFNESEYETIPRKHVGGGGEPLVGKDGKKLTKRLGVLTSYVGARRTDNITRVATPPNINQEEILHPWGRPGAGAPLIDDKGVVIKKTKGKMKHEAKGLSYNDEVKIDMAKEIYRNELKKGIQDQRKNRDTEKYYHQLPEKCLYEECRRVTMSRSCPGDVPSWFSRGQVGRPKRDPITGIIVPQKRIASDVTAQKFNTDKPRDSETYYRDLKKVAEERFTKRVAERERLMKLETKHHSTFQNYFSRPGNGAPHTRGLKRRMFSNNALVPAQQKGTLVVAPENRLTGLHTLRSRLRLSSPERKGCSTVYKTDFTDRWFGMCSN